MKRISKSMLGVTSALVGGVAVFALMQFNTLGREGTAPPQLHIEGTPVHRGGEGTSSYAPIIKRAGPSVVNIYSTRTVRMPRMRQMTPMWPFFNDPMFRQFFEQQGQGEDSGPPNRGGGRGNRDTATRQESSLGSGVIVSTDGYVLTANHVIDGADPDGVKVALASGGTQYTAKIVGTDPLTDLAVLKIDATSLSAITLADSDKLEVGDVVLAIGNPFGLGQTVTMGIVSALGRTSLGIIPEGYENFIQTDAPINRGNSGGALIDAEGRLVGINTAIFTPSGANAGVGFAVPVNMARNVMQRLIESGTVSRGYLGVNIQTLTPEIAEEFQLPDASGAIVTDIRSDTPAARAGLQSGDVIREVNGKKVEDSRQLRLLISQSEPGSKVALRILRSEPGRKPAERTITATLGKLPTEEASAGGQRPGASEESPKVGNALAGVEVSDIDAELRQHLNIPAGVRGALVTSVDPESPPATAGLRQGDVILEFNRLPVRSADDVVQMSGKAAERRVLLRIWRNGGGLFITIDNSARQ